MQSSPTECGVSQCDRETLIMRRPRFTRGCYAMRGEGFYACSVVGIMTRLRTGQTGVLILEGAREFSVFFKPSGPAQDPSSLTFNTCDIFTGSSAAEAQR